MDNIIFMIGLQLFLIFLNAIFACAEIAVISMNDAKLSKLSSEGDKRAKKLKKLTDEPARFLATIQVAITLSGFLGSAFAAENFSELLVSWVIDMGVTLPVTVLETISVIAITIILSYFTLVLGELVPKQLAMRKAEQIALGISGLISGISKIFKPIVSLLTVSTNGILRLMRINPNETDDEVSEEEIRMMVDVGNEKGTIDNDEREFIHNVFDFDNLSVGEIITHRKDVILLDTEDSDEEWEKTIFSTDHTYYPVCNKTADKIVGILNSKKYFRLEDKTRENVLKNAVTHAYFVPESLKADVLFKNMKKERILFSIVLDEYGGMSGIVTIKDLVEELIGDYDNDTEDTTSITQMGNGLWKVGGATLLENISKVLEHPIPDDDCDTLNGLVFHTLGSFPEIGTEIEAANLNIKVLEIENLQIKTALIKKIEEQKEEE